MKGMRLILPLLLFFLLVFSSYGKIGKEVTTLNGGNLFYVGGNGPNNYTTIQDAIDAANDGDTIFVYSGIYYEHVVVNKSINLVGENEKTTIIDGRNENAEIFKIDANNVEFSHFTIRNIKTDGWTYGIVATGNNIIISNCITKNVDGLEVYRMENGLIENCNFSHNYWGIDFYTKCRNITIRNCTITYNLGKRWSNGGYKGGDGISFMFDARNFYNISIINCNLSNNRFSGVDASYFANLIVKNCIINGNRWGVLVEGMKNVTIMNCKITDNLYYGIRTVGDVTTIVKNCIITGTENWSGISVLKNRKGKIVIDRCKINNNYNHGVEAYYSMKIYIRNSSICSNEIGIYAKFSIINARYNYWGSPLGPSHLFGLRGDKIVARFSKVFYFPWLKEEYKQ